MQYLEENIRTRKYNCLKGAVESKDDDNLNVGEPYQLVM